MAIATSIVTPISLSGGTDYQGFTLATTATYTTLHTASATANVRDEVWLWAYNVSAADAYCEIGFGLGGSADSPFRYEIVSKSGPYLVIPGITIQNSVQAYGRSETASAINVFGYVNRII